jgi:hypothetical protein
MLKTIFIQRNCIGFRGVLAFRIFQYYRLACGIIVRAYWHCLGNHPSPVGLSFNPAPPSILVVFDNHRLNNGNCPATIRLLSLSDSPQVSVGSTFDPLSGPAAYTRNLILASPRILLLILIFPFFAHYFLEQYWYQFLKNSHFRVVISIMPSPPLVSACRRLGIKSVDLQHGTVSASHQWYSQRLIAGSPLFPYSPDYFALWDNISRSSLLSLIRACGHASQHSEESLIIVGNGLKCIPLSQPRNAQYPFEILVTTSYYHAFYYSHEELSMLDDFRLLTREFFLWALTCSNIRFNFRLHPTCTDKRLIALQKSGVAKLVSNNARSIFKISTSSLEQDLADCSLHLTLNSSVCIQAASLGIPSLFLSPAQLRSECYEHFKALSNSIVFRSDHQSFQESVDACISLVSLTNSDSVSYETPSDQLPSFLASLLTSMNLDTSSQHAT